MAVNPVSNTVSFTGNGVATAFTIPFKFAQNPDLVVTYTPNGSSVAQTWTLGNQYSVSGAGNDAGGTLTVTGAAPASGDKLTVTRSSALQQLLALQSQGPFPPLSITQGLDLLTMISQDLSALITGLQTKETTDANNIATLQTQVTNITVPTTTTPTQLFPSVLALPSQTLTLDCSKGTEVHTVLDANLTVANPINTPSKGIRLRHSFAQDGTGYRTITWGTAWNGVANVMPRQGPGQLSDITFISNGDGTFNAVAFDAIDLTKPLSVLDYGCPSDGASDCAPALQAALNTGKHLFFPALQYVIRTPLIQKNGAQNLIGEKSGQSGTFPAINNGAGVGPALVQSAATQTLPTVTALLTGTGAAGSFDGTSNYWLGWSDNGYTSLNGLGAFTVEFAFNLTSLPSTANCWVACMGQRETVTTVFSIGTSGFPSGGLDTLTASVNIGGTLKTVTSGTTKVGTSAVHNVAVTYDGTNLRMFIDGTLVGTTAATGNVYQPPWCDWTMGTGSSFMGEGGAGYLPGTPSAIDGVRISKTARYTASYTNPTAKPAWDTNSLFLCNFDNQSGMFTVAKSAYQTGGTYTNHWIPLRRLDAPLITGGLIQNLFFVEGIIGDSTAIWSNGFNGVTMDNCTFKTKVHLFYNAFNWYIKGCSFSGDGAASRYALLLGVAANVTVIDNCVFNDGQYQLAVAFAAGTSLKGLDMRPTANTIVCLAINGDGPGSSSNNSISISDCELDVETAGSNWECPMVLSNMHIVSVRGGVFESPNNPVPIVKVSNCYIVDFEGSFFKPQTSAMEIVNADGTVAGVVHFRGCYKIQGVWSNTAFYTVNGYAAPQSKTASYTVAFPGLQNCNATSGALVPTLPAANTVFPGTEFVFKKTDSSANAVTVTAAGADKIDGASTFALTAQYKYVRLICDGSANWEVTGSN